MKMTKNKEDNIKNNGNVLNVETRICPNCAKTYDYDPYKNNYAPFCSKECMNNIIKGG